MVMFVFFDLQDMIEDMLTVTKQKDMSGFYRHLYRQTMGEEKGQKAEAVAAIKTEQPEIKTEVEEGETQDDDDDDDDDKIAAPVTEEEDKKKLEKVKARSYRTKVKDEESEQSDNEDSDSQLESDSDSSGNKLAQIFFNIKEVRWQGKRLKTERSWVQSPAEARKVEKYFLLFFGWFLEPMRSTSKY